MISSFILQHVYHEACILPWLKLHGTCPICRKSLVPEENSANAAAHVANQLRKFQSTLHLHHFSIHSIAGLSIGGQQASTSQEGSNSTMDSNNSSNNSSENAPGSSSNRRRDDVEFDFD